MLKQIGFTLILALLSLLLLPLPLLLADEGDQSPYQVPWWTVDSGGGSSSNNEYKLVGTAGQFDAGSVKGGSYELYTGFWNRSVTEKQVAQLLISPTVLSFNALVGRPNPAPLSFTIANSSTGSLNWVATENASWLSLDVLTGTAAATVTVSVDTSDLTENTYRTGITITDAAAANSPQVVAVTLNLLAAPRLEVSPAQLAFQAVLSESNPPSQSLNINNRGRGSLVWTATETLPWLGLDSSSGTAPGTVNVSVDIAGLSAGSYSGGITITAPAADEGLQVIPISLTLSAPPEPPRLSVSPQVLSFTAEVGGNNPAARSVTISNTGGSTLVWTATESVPWLQVSPNSGTDAGTFNVSVDIAVLSSNVYSTPITVSAAGALDSPQVIVATLELRAPPPGGLLYLPLVIK